MTHFHIPWDAEVVWNRRVWHPDTNSLSVCTPSTSVLFWQLQAAMGPIVLTIWQAVGLIMQRTCCHIVTTWFSIVQFHPVEDFFGSMLAISGKCQFTTQWGLQVRGNNHFTVSFQPTSCWNSLEPWGITSWNRGSSCWLMGVCRKQVEASQGLQAVVVVDTWSKNIPFKAQLPCFGGEVEGQFFNYFRFTVCWNWYCHCCWNCELLVEYKQAYFIDGVCRECVFIEGLKQFLIILEPLFPAAGYVVPIVEGAQIVFGCKAVF